VGKQVSEALPLGSYTALDPRASGKRLVGCFSEAADQDSAADAKSEVNPAWLRRMAGIRTICTDGSSFPVRGYWEMAGVQYCVIGPNLYQMSVDPVTQQATLTQLNGSTAITGNGFVRMADNNACMVILQPGTNNMWTWSLTSAASPYVGTFAVLTVPAGYPTVTMNLWYLDNFIVFLGGGAQTKTFYNDQGFSVTGFAQISFATSPVASFTREFGTDPFVGGVVDHRQLLLFGVRTTEGYVTGTNNPTGSPFAASPDSFAEIGCHPLCGDTVTHQDQAPFFVANDLTVRRLNGQTPVVVSNSGVDQILQQIASPNGEQGSLLGAYALVPTVSGHPLYILQLPNAISPEGTKGRTLCYDCKTQKWFELASYTPAGDPLGMWRVLCYYNGLGGQLVGDALGSNVGILDTTIFSEFGGPMICEWTYQSVYAGHNRIIVRRIEVVVTPGAGSSLTVAPTIDLLTSIDGRTYESFQDPQNLGLPGCSDQRAQWWNLGQYRDLFIRNRVTDPTPLFTVDAQVTFEPAVL
jgi:hypothetical protein